MKTEVKEIIKIKVKNIGFNFKVRFSIDNQYIDYNEYIDYNDLNSEIHKILE